MSDPETLERQFAELLKLNSVRPYLKNWDDGPPMRPWSSCGYTPLSTMGTPAPPSEAGTLFCAGSLVARGTRRTSSTKRTGGLAQ
jgi:hypothetical protein